MPKASKSSASAGTRKKHAKKATKGEDDATSPTSQQGKKPQRGEKQLSKAQRKALPKIKQYIPPPKPPAPPIPDPLDGQGLARTLPADLVVILRRLGKKDEVTRRKGLEELREWIRSLGEGDELERELKETAIVSAVPVWLHNLSSLLQSPFHRFLALQLHSTLLALPDVRSAIMDTLSLGLLPGTQNRDVLGSWIVAAIEEGKKGDALTIWDASTTWSGSSTESIEGRINLHPQLEPVSEFLTLAILDPASLHDDIHPAPIASTPAASTPPSKVKGAKPRAYTPIATPSEPSPAEEQTKSDLMARYRIGGLTGLVWLVQQLAREKLTPPESVYSLIRHPVLWSALVSEAKEDSENIGVDQPAIRRAGYSLLDTLLEHLPEEVARDETLEMLSQAVLENCWMEKDMAVWQQGGVAIVKFLSKHRNAWVLASASPPDQPTNGEQSEIHATDDTGSEDEDEEDPDIEEGDPPPAIASSPSIPKPVSDFLGFLSTICPLLPQATYPLLLVIVSTIPDEYMPLNSPPSEAVLQLFTHLWGPVDARLLSTHSLPNQPSVFQMFFQGALDITIFLLGRATRKEDSTATITWLLQDQLIDRAWKEGVLELGGRGGRRRGQDTGTETEGAIFGKGLGRVAALDPSFITFISPAIHASFSERCFRVDDGSSKGPPVLARILPILSQVREHTKSDEVTAFVDLLIGELCRELVDHIGKICSADSGDLALAIGVLSGILAQHASLVDENTRKIIIRSPVDNLDQYTAHLSPVTLVDLLEAIIKQDPTAMTSLSDALWSYANDSNRSASGRFSVAKEIASRPNSPLFVAGAFDSTTLEAVSVLGLSDPTGVDLAVLSVKLEYALSGDTLQTILALVSSEVYSRTDALLGGEEGVAIPVAALRVLQAYVEHHSDIILDSDVFSLALVAAHHLVFLLPRNSLETFPAPPVAHSIWRLVESLEAGKQRRIGEQVSIALSDMLGQTGCLIQPAVIVDVALSATFGGTRAEPAALIKSLLPNRQQMSTIMSRHTAQTPPTSLAIVHEQVVMSSERAEESLTYDHQGRSTAARLADGISCLLRADRRLIQTDPWLLLMTLQASKLAQDARDLSSASRYLFSHSTSRTLLEDTVREADGWLSFALSVLGDPPTSWHSDTIDTLKGKTAPEKDFLQELLRLLKENMAEHESDVSSRIFSDVLSRFFRQNGTGEQEAELWLNYAVSLADRDPALSMAILLSIKPILIDADRFHTAQSRFASALTSIPPSKANKQGIPALRVLLASAPPLDAASLFLPQQRAVFVLRHLSTWLSSDEADDFEDSMEAYVAQIYTHLAPVVQDLSGQHWEAMFDLVESGLDSSSMSEPDTFPLLYACLTLLRQIRDLAATNKTLRAIWTAKNVHLGIVLRLFLECRDADSTPIQMIQALILDLLQDVPGKTVEDADLEQLCDLLHLCASPTIQTTAYRILSRVIQSRTVALVLEVEASVADVEDAKGRTEIAFPPSIIRLVRSGSDIDWLAEGQKPVVLGQLLAWMAVLDHFNDASRSLRWAYLDQLNTTALLESSLLPMLFSILGIAEVGAWTFPAGQYAVDEFYPDLIEPEDLADLAPFASHLFYRSLVTLPSAMRAYYESLKDRQLSMSMLNFTARHYSPIIIKHEFSALREPASLAQLTEEGLNVRIAQGGGTTIAAGTGSAEAIASYVVDEQPMEIGIRLPAEFPLRAVDVRDLKRVGVPENKWRGWLISVQQTITSRNGLILEALTVFKKNVSLHFEGVVECAICYSIISLTDRTLPTKPCRTCKNRFHASCLFKWFNSSHSSSCPMCRALF